MKKFTCLLLIALAITYTLSAACTNSATTNAFLARVEAYTTGTVTTTTSTVDTAVCASAADLCCDVTKMKAIVKAEITKVKTTLTAFGTGASKIGSIWTKIASLVNSSAITGTTSAADTLAASTESGATGAQWKAFATYTNTTFQTDFDNFKGQAVTCFDFYSTAIQKIGCDGCKDAAPTRWTSTTSGAIQLNAASISAWAAACNKVWYFMWKTGWFVQSVAYLNNKKATAAYSAPTLANIYFNSGSVTIDNVNTAFASCYPDAATTVTACDATMRGNLVKAFVQVYGTSTTNFGRGDTTIIATGTFASNGARRMLAVTTTDGTVMAAATDADGFALTTATATYPPTDAVTFVASDTTAWSSGYVASSSSSSSSSSTTTKNAKVVIGTILSALFAIAFLN